MKEWVEFSKCVGKTIAGQVLDGYEPDRWLIAFTDGTWSSIEWGLPGYPEGEIQLQSRRPPLTEHVAGLKRLGLIDQNEADRLLEEHQAERRARTDARERAEYERLHAKFGKGEASDYRARCERALEMATSIENWDRDSPYSAAGIMRVLKGEDDS